MIVRELSLEEMRKILFESKIIGQGTYGIVTQSNGDTLIKIYYKEIQNTYFSKDISRLDKEIQDNIEIEKELEAIFPRKRTKLEEMKDHIEQLEKTKSGSLIKGIATYKGYLIGVFLEEYRGYELLRDIFEKLGKEKRKVVLSSAAILLGDLYKHGIIPRDIKEDNIMVRKEDLDVKLIDLDDSETRYETQEYLEKFPHIKQQVIESFKDMKKRLQNVIEQSEGIER